MSTPPSGPVSSVTFAQFLQQLRELIVSGQLVKWDTFGVSSQGTVVVIETKGGQLIAYVINDVNFSLKVGAFSSTMKIERMGQSSVSISASQLRGTASISLSPPLSEAISNYRVFPNISAATNAAQYLRTARLSLSNTTTLQIEIFRNFNSAILSNAATGVTVGAGDLLDVDTVANTVHGADAGFAPHGHTTTGHPVTDPQHTHTVAGLNNSLAADTYTVDWMIIHT